MDSGVLRNQAHDVSSHVLLSRRKIYLSDRPELVHHGGVCNVCVFNDGVRQEADPGGSRAGMVHSGNLKWFSKGESLRGLFLLYFPKYHTQVTEKRVKLIS